MRLAMHKIVTARRAYHDRSGLHFPQLIRRNAWVVTLADQGSLIGWLTSSILCTLWFIRGCFSPQPQLAIDLAPCRHVGRVCTHLCAGLIDLSAPSWKCVRARHACTLALFLRARETSFARHCPALQRHTDHATR